MGSYQGAKLCAHFDLSSVLFQLQFCEQLSQILSTPSVNVVCRRAAGLQLKNQLTSKEQITRNAQVRRWIESDTDTKGRIKQNVSL